MEKCNNESKDAMTINLFGIVEFDGHVKIKVTIKLPNYTACTFDIRLYLTPLGQARQFIETCGS